MEKISVVIRKDTGAIEITPELVEEALNFYLGMDASVTVFAASQQSFAPDATQACGCPPGVVHTGDGSAPCGL